jgi:hypothetical protein
MPGVGEPGCSTVSMAEPLSAPISPACLGACRLTKDTPGAVGAPEGVTAVTPGWLDHMLPRPCAAWNILLGPSITLFSKLLRLGLPTG